MSQNIRPTPCSSGRHGRTPNVVGSGIAIMSDSSIGLKPVIDEPSNPIPPSNASASSVALIENALSWPRMSVNHSRMNRMLRSCTSARTSSAVAGKRWSPSDGERYLRRGCAGRGRRGGRETLAAATVPPSQRLAQRLQLRERRLELAPHLRTARTRTRSGGPEMTVRSTMPRPRAPSSARTAGGPTAPGPPGRSRRNAAALHQHRAGSPRSTGGRPVRPPRGRGGSTCARVSPRQTRPCPRALPSCSR